MKKSISDKISVIIPTFNRGWCISEALKSVLKQDYTSSCRSVEMMVEADLPVEVIVVDDGSTDNTYEVLKPFTENGLIKLLKQKNQGVSAARNLGISQSSGAFVAFLDSDDLWLPDKLSCQMDFFGKNPNAMICQTEEIWIRNGKRVNPKYKHKKLSGMIFEPSLHLCLVSPSAVMMRRDFFSIKGFFDEALPACEDYDLWLRTSTDMAIWLVDKPCIIKNGGHDDQLSANHSLDKYRIRSICNLLESDTRHTTLTSAQREAALKVLQEKCTIYSQGCLKRGKREEARYYRELALSSTV